MSDIPVVGSVKVCDPELEASAYLVLYGLRLDGVMFWKASMLPYRTSDAARERAQQVLREGAERVRIVRVLLPVDQDTCPGVVDCKELVR